MKYIVDIDNTICPQSEDSDYTNTLPWQERIAQINKLYDEGHEIHYWTSRGSRTGRDWSHFTVEQLTEWGCKFNSVRVGKPHYDVWIDDKSMWPFEPQLIEKEEVSPNEDTGSDDDGKEVHRPLFVL